MDFYPYLERYVAFDELQGKKVLEVGLGYGTVGQKIAESGADYTGLDIAEGPVSMMNHRLGQCGLPGKAIQGSILEAPFEHETFDRVVAIGCYHHTGDTKRAISETARILKPGGQALVMVYNAYSYRRWLRSPLDTWRYYRDDNDDGIETQQSRERARAEYDVNQKGEAAPVTAFLSAAHIKRLASDWSKVDVRSENAGDELFLRFFPRRLKLQWFGGFLGLDIYCQLYK